MFDLDDADPAYQLVWPRDLFVTELTEVRRLQGSDGEWAKRVLEEAFFGSAPVEDLDRPVSWVEATTVNDGWGGQKVVVTPESFYNTLIARVDDLRLYSEPRPYWGAARPTRAVDVFSSDELREAWISLVDRMVGNGYLALVAPTGCVDVDTAPEHPDSVLEREIRARIGVAGLYPFREPEVWSDDTFYGLVEVFHDLVARPRARRYHDWDKCGWHYSDFAIKPGRVLYRSMVNELFARSDAGLELAVRGEDAGRLVRSTSDPRTDLVSRQVNSPNDQDAKRHAIALYRSRGGTVEDKRSACIVLSGLLEQERDLVKEELLSKDEGALFQIMNQFAVRHRSANQRAQYDAVYLDWVFWWFLATVDLIEQLKIRAPTDAARDFGRPEQ